eukprot:scaffold36283_cov200-Skeletonema_dohrnii-CCMP3373.AAC.1
MDDSYVEERGCPLSSPSSFVSQTQHSCATHHSLKYVKALNNNKVIWSHERDQIKPIVRLSIGRWKLEVGNWKLVERLEL